MFLLLPAYRASRFVVTINTIQTDDVHTGGVTTTLRPRQRRGRRHLMPALGCDVECVCHSIVVVTNMVIPVTGVIRERDDLLQLISLGELILKFSYPDGRK
jgi:hypothetical protein